MKSNFSLRHAAPLLAACLLPTFAQAHPGHSVFDWTVLPHGGHESAYALLFTILALTTVCFVSYWVASRKR
jgi:hypothetical protein